MYIILITSDGRRDVLGIRKTYEIFKYKQSNRGRNSQKYKLFCNYLPQDLARTLMQGNNLYTLKHLSLQYTHTRARTHTDTPKKPQNNKRKANKQTGQASYILP